MKHARNLGPDDGPGEPSSQPERLASWYAPGLSDGLGDRLLMFDNSSAPSLELLRLRPELANAPGFEEALRERVKDLSGFRHPSFASVRAVEHLEPDAGLAVVSNYTPGKRLSQVLHQARGPAFATALIRQLTPALLLLQQHGHGIAHGALGIDRIVVTPGGRLTIVEHVLGSALDGLQLSAKQLNELGIAVPPRGPRSPSKLDGQTDFYQLGLIALSLLLGRRLPDREYAHNVQKLLDEVGVSHGDSSPLLPALRRWLERALQVNDAAFESGADAQDALEELIAEGGSDRAEARPALLTFHSPTAEATAGPAMPDPLLPPRRDVEAQSMAREAMIDRGTGPDAASVPDESARPKNTQRTDSAATGQVTPFRRPGQEPAGAALTELPVVEGPTEPHAAPVAAARVEPRRTVTNSNTARGTKQGDAAANRRGHRARWIIAALTVCAAAEAGVIAGLLHKRPWQAAAPITLETREPGATVLVDGRSAGVTPLEVKLDSSVRSIRIVPGASTEAAAVESKPAPVTTVKAQEPRTAEKPPPAAPRLGHIRLSSPIDLQVFEGDRLLGQAPGGALSIPPGRHELVMVNALVGYRSRQIVDVKPGHVVAVTVTPPDGRVSINAVPWAEVSIDGKSVGETPLGNLTVSLGEHEFVFRHPQLGERRQTAIVRSDGVTRVTANLQR